MCFFARARERDKRSHTIFVARSSFFEKNGTLRGAGFVDIDDEESDFDDEEAQVLAEDGESEVEGRARRVSRKFTPQDEKW